MQDHLATHVRGGHLQRNGQPTDRLGLLAMARHEECGLAGPRGQPADEGNEMQRSRVPWQGFERKDLHDVVNADLSIRMSFEAATNEEPMQHRCFGHGARRYTARVLATLALAGVWPAGPAALPRADAAEGRRLPATGVASPFHVKVPGRDDRFSVLAVAGCRYRLEARGDTLTRPVLAVGRVGEDPFVKADAGPDSTVARLEWDAVRDEALDVRVGGFSAMVGRGTVAWTTLGPEDAPTEAHRRHLVAGEEHARVGELLIGEANDWIVAAEPGVAYQITPTEGTAGRVRLLLHASGAASPASPLRDSEEGPLSTLPLAPLRFLGPHLAPEGVEGGAATSLRLEVRGLFDGGGTYGLRMRRLVEGETVDPEGATLRAPEPAAVLEQPPGCTFRAGPGDLALLHLPHAPDNPHFVLVQRGNSWIAADELGQQQRARTHYHAALAWFRPWRAGTFRFAGVLGPVEEGTLQLLDRSTLGGAPIHLGTGVDPEVRVRLSKTWTLTGLGACMPGWDYLFALRGAGSTAGMRVIAPDGRVLATRTGGAGATWSPGIGPTLRFRAAVPGIYRLEARATKSLVVAAVLRHAEESRDKR